MAARLIMKLQVAEARFATPDVLHVTFAHPRKPELPAWTPGAHVDLHLPDGAVRQYSLCGDPLDRSRYEIAIKREAGESASAWAHENLRPGAMAPVSAPRNHFPLAEGARRHILVAGGIGVTPFIAMARQLARDKADFVLHFCAASAKAAPLLPELKILCGARLQTWFSDEGRRFDLAAIGPPEEGRHLYLCGPPRLVEAALSHAAASRWRDSHVHREIFKPSLDAHFTPEPFDAVIASTGHVMHVPAEKSLLEALREHGVKVPSSCEIGVCGACVCGWRDGEVVHRDSILSAENRGDSMTPCVSRARGRVTLDL